MTPEKGTRTVHYRYTGTEPRIFPTVLYQATEGNFVPLEVMPGAIVDLGDVIVDHPELVPFDSADPHPGPADWPADDQAGPVYDSAVADPASVPAQED